MEDEKQQETSLIDIEGYVYQVKREDTGSRIRISKGDYLILRVYREKKRKPIPTIIHCMIGQAAKCWLEKHTERIEELESQAAVLEHIVKLYYQRYGPLRVIRRQQQP